MDASERGRLLDKLADLVERDRAVLAVSSLRKHCLYPKFTLPLKFRFLHLFENVMWSRPGGKAKEYIIYMKNERHLAFAVRLGKWRTSWVSLLTEFWRTKPYLPMTGKDLLPPSHLWQTTVKQQEFTMLSAENQHRTIHFRIRKVRFYLPGTNPSWLKRNLQKHRAWYALLVHFRSLCSVIFSNSPPLISPGATFFT